MILKYENIMNLSDSTSSLVWHSNIGGTYENTYTNSM